MTVGGGPQVMPCARPGWAQGPPRGTDCQRAQVPGTAVLGRGHWLATTARSRPGSVPSCGALQGSSPAREGSQPPLGGASAAGLCGAPHVQKEALAVGGGSQLLPPRSLCHDQRHSPHCVVPGLSAASHPHPGLAPGPHVGGGVRGWVCWQLLLEACPGDPFRGTLVGTAGVDLAAPGCVCVCAWACVWTRVCQG